MYLDSNVASCHISTGWYITLSDISLTALKRDCRKLRPTASIYKKKFIQTRRKKAMFIAKLLEIKKWDCCITIPTGIFYTTEDRPQQLQDRQHRRLSIVGRVYMTCSCRLKVCCARNSSMALIPSCSLLFILTHRRITGWARFSVPPLII